MRRLRRRKRRYGVVVLVGWAGVGLMGVMSGEPDTIGPGLFVFVVGVVVMTRKIARETPLECGGGDNGDNASDT